MNKLINRKVLISMLFIGLTMMGVFSYKYLKMELYPDAEYRLSPSVSLPIWNSTPIMLKRRPPFRWKA